MKLNLSFVYIPLVFLSYVILADDIDDLDEATVEVEDPENVDVPYASPSPVNPSKVYFAEHFDDLSQFKKRWIKSQAKKEGISEDIAKYDGHWEIEPAQKDALTGDSGLVLKTNAKHAAISAPLDKPFVFSDKTLIVQYEVILQDGQECGGAYLKLLTDAVENKDLKNFHDRSPYSIMFGPDKCGNDHKLHFIFKHKNPLNGSIEEKHCKKPKERLEDIYADKRPHLYTLILSPDNSFEVRIDNTVVNSGSLLEDFTPSVNPLAEIDDPTDKKPDDWDEREKIPDPEAIKPDDWDESAPSQIIDETAAMPEGWLEDEPKHIPDPNAKKPEDWDTEMDGVWEAPLIENPACAKVPGCGKWEPPLIDNPNYKGKWRAPLIDNPNYKGKWRPRKIPNPNYYEDKQPFKMQTISAVGFELWSMSKDIYFDNIIIAEDIQVIEQWTQSTYDKKKLKMARDSESFIQRLANWTNEYPILWAVYIVVLGIPVTFLLYLCCRPSASATQEQEELKHEAERKKTDAVTPDTVEEVAEPESQEDDQDGEDNKKENQQEETVTSKADRERHSDSDKEKYSGSDEEDEPLNKEAPSSQSGEGDVPRKRKPRKE